MNRLIIGAVIIAAPLIAYMAGTAEPPTVKQWIETGYPTKNWRIRVCRIHHQLLVYYPYDPPHPLHNILDIDPTKAPFYPRLLSSTTANEAIQTHLVRSFARKFSEELSDARRTGEDVSEMVDIATTVFSLLANDDTREHYANIFLPVFKKGAMDGLKSQETIRKERIGELKKLCT
ncbi:hypothetical protein ACHAQD_008391 [Fusarium lateritium]